MTSKKERIEGIDLARSVAMIGMIAVNFKIVLGAKGNKYLEAVLDSLEGQAAATFVVLAGIGIALMTKKAHPDMIKVRKKLLSKALFLFILGTIFLIIWPADILHFYGIYIAITALSLKLKDKQILMFCAFIILFFLILVLFCNYQAEWNFKTLEYHGLWTVKGFLKNLFFNGFHPVIPWLVFMLFGFWFGKKNLKNRLILQKTLKYSIVIIISFKLFKVTAISYLPNFSQLTTSELEHLLNTNPIPPLPLYLANGIAFAMIIISSSILIAQRFRNNKIIEYLSNSGQLALTCYIAHIVIGLGLIEIVIPQKMGLLPLEFSFLYALIFSLTCVLFSKIWLTYFKQGPLEKLMRKFTK